jgi:Zn-dependent protease
VTMAGPLTHILQGGIWAGMYAAVKKGDFSSFSNDISLEELREGGAVAFISNLCVQAIVFNGALIIANLAIPSYPLDGGRALVAFLVMGEFKVATAARITSMLGVVVGLIMLFVGAYLYAAETSASGLFLAVVASFVISSGLRMWKAVTLGRLYEHPLFRLECYRNLRRRPPSNSNSSPQQSTSGRIQVPIASHII